MAAVADSLESNLSQMEQYLSTNPYREYAMHRPYLPSNKSLSSLVQTTGTFKRLNNNAITTKLSSTYHELIDNRKPIVLDRLTYKLRMKSNLNVNNLNESKSNHYNNDLLHQLTTLKTSRTMHHAPTIISATTTNTNTMPSMKLNSSSNDQSTSDIMVQANAMHVGTLDDLIKQFRRAEYKIIKRPDLNSASTNQSSISTKQSASERTKHKLSQPLTEYQLNVPLSSGNYQRSPTTILDNNSGKTINAYYKDDMHQGVVYHYRTRERTDYGFQLPNEIQHTRTPVPSYQQSTERLHDSEVNRKINNDKRIKNAREKVENRNEKKVCICNKLTIIDPFHNLNVDDVDDGQLPHLKHHVPSVRYIFPPVRPFGYFTRKKQSTDDDNMTPPPLLPKPKTRRRRRKKQVQHDSATTGNSDNDTLKNDSVAEKDDDYDIITLNGTLDDAQNSFEESVLNFNAPLLSTDEQQKR
ncbi:unnamed protein product [Didymodactylos carnosus]|uniref:Uncharacterized protein n=1 Tax=Didymodactylos carnosus TaxID=1234261 RepID=A0A813XY83_9BILA|nr:unnamed protein product [Didymodactylos carnosus]CAF3663387.1 unnamed protein product [Didymodactylos carnosus]